MTTIAWDGTTLAGDRAAWSGSFKYRVRKVHRIESAQHGHLLVGLAGDGGYAMALLDWLHDGKDPGQYPEKDKTYCVALVVKRNRTVWKIDNNLRWVRVLGRLQAAGGGQEMAMGALAAGASALRAVRITMRHSDLAGIGVDVVRF